MRNIAILLFSTLLVVASCADKENLPSVDEDYLAFGTYYGECFGNCTQFYLIEDGEIYADDIEIGVPGELVFQSEPLAPDKYDIAVELVSGFPSDLLASDKRTYGCPDCADQGGIMLETRVDGEVTRWHIDTQDVDQSQQIIDYKTRLLEIMAELE